MIRIKCSGPSAVCERVCLGWYVCVCFFCTHCTECMYVCDAYLERVASCVFVKSEACVLVGMRPMSGCAQPCATVDR